jgi:di/tricarboxylate transporter
VYGSFVNGVVANAGIPASPGLLFLMPLLLNAAIAAGVYLALRHRAPANQLEMPDPAGAETHPQFPTEDPGSTNPRATAVQVRTTTPPQTVAEFTLNRERTLTLLGLTSLAIGTVAFDLDVGFLALTVASLVTFLYPHRTNDAVAKVNWSTVLLICGVVTYVGLLEEVGTIDYASHQIVAIGIPLVAALLLCYLGGITSAFASSIGILAVLIPLAVPFLKEGSVSAIGTVTALAFAATVVDVSPFSTNGALILANTSNSTRAAMYRQMLLYSAIVVATAPAFAWLVLVASGWF